MNLEVNIKRYLDGVSESDGRRPDARYASFDYCFNYFQSFREARNIAALASSANLQLSCLHLGFYLASWGMLRGLCGAVAAERQASCANRPADRQS